MAREPNFAVLTTLMPDGRPQSHVMWVDADDTALIINTETHRQKYRNVLRDPRVTVVIMDRRDPYRFVEVRGVVRETIGGERARVHIDELSSKYRGMAYSSGDIRSGRTMLRITPERIVPGNND